MIGLSQTRSYRRSDANSVALSSPRVITLASGTALALPKEHDENENPVTYSLVQLPCGLEQVKPALRVDVDAPWTVHPAVVQPSVVTPLNSTTMLQTNPRFDNNPTASVVTPDSSSVSELTPLASSVGSSNNSHDSSRPNVTPTQANVDVTTPKVPPRTNLVEEKPEFTGPFTADDTTVLEDSPPTLQTRLYQALAVALAALLVYQVHFQQATVFTILAWTIAMGWTLWLNLYEDLQWRRLPRLLQRSSQLDRTRVALHQSQRQLKIKLSRTQAKVALVGGSDAHEKLLLVTAINQVQAMLKLRQQQAVLYHFTLALFQSNRTIGRLYMVNVLTLELWERRVQDYVPNVRIPNRAVQSWLHHQTDLPNKVLSRIYRELLSDTTALVEYRNTKSRPVVEP